MRIMSSDADMRNQYQYAQFRQEQEQLRIQIYATPPSQRSPNIKHEKDKRNNLPESEADSAADELTTSLIHLLLKKLTGRQPPVMTLAELTSTLIKQTTNADTWQHVADSLQDILLPTRYPHTHFDKKSTTLTLPIQVTTKDKKSVYINTEIKLSGVWLQAISQRQNIEGLINDDTLSIQLKSDHLDLAQIDLSLDLDINLDRYLSNHRLENIQNVDFEHGLPISTNQILAHIQFWGMDEANEHRLLAVGVEDIGVVYLGMLQKRLLYQGVRYPLLYRKPINIPPIDITV